jgi:SHS2 domain-containing protein
LLERLDPRQLLRTRIEIDKDYDKFLGRVLSKDFHGEGHEKARASGSTRDMLTPAPTGSTDAEVVKVGWEHFPHDADLGLRGFGASPAEAFEQAALALTAAITDTSVAPRTSVDVHCEAPDIELLFVEWLNAIIYEMAVRRMLFGSFTVHTDGERLEGKLWGEPVDVERHAPACEPKGATYTALKVAKSPDGLWSASCVVDV